MVRKKFRSSKQFLTLQFMAAVADSWPVLKNGSTGSEVSTLQYLLNALGITCNVDGDFGPVAETAVKSFQERT